MPIRVPALVSPMCCPHVNLSSSRQRCECICICICIHVSHPIAHPPIQRLRRARGRADEKLTYLHLMQSILSSRQQRPSKPRWRAAAAAYLNPSFAEIPQRSQHGRHGSVVNNCYLNRPSSTALNACSQTPAGGSITPRRIRPSASPRESNLPSASVQGCAALAASLTKKTGPQPSSLLPSPRTPSPPATFCSGNAGEDAPQPPAAPAPARAPAMAAPRPLRSSTAPLRDSLVCVGAAARWGGGGAAGPAGGVHGGAGSDCAEVRCQRRAGEGVAEPRGVLRDVEGACGFLGREGRKRRKARGDGGQC